MKINFAASLVLLLFSFGCSNQTKSAAPSNEPPGTAHREPSGSSAQGVNQDQGSSGAASGTPQFRRHSEQHGRPRRSHLAGRTGRCRHRPATIGSDRYVV